MRGGWRARISKQGGGSGHAFKVQRTGQGSPVYSSYTQRQSVASANPGQPVETPQLAPCRGQHISAQNFDTNVSA